MPFNLTWSLGASADFLDNSRGIDRHQFNPKVGVTWQLLSSTTVRAAGFRVLKRLLIANQTIEPTHVAGFNQFYDDVNGTASKRFGIAIDQKLLPALFTGLELSKRDLKVPITRVIGPPVTRQEDQQEQAHRVYLYWTPSVFLAFSAEYQFEQTEREFLPTQPDTTRPTAIRTHCFPFSLNVYHPRQ
jgi:hypothetical protein